MAHAPTTWILTGSREEPRDPEHVRTWPPEHRKPAFQGQLGTVTEADGGLLLHRTRAAAGVRA